MNLNMTQAERSIRDGSRIALGFVAYMGAVPKFVGVYREIVNGFPVQSSKVMVKSKRGIPFVRITARKTEIRADSREARLAALPPRRTKMKITWERVGGGSTNIGGGIKPTDPGPGI